MINPLNPIGTLLSGAAYHATSGRVGSDMTPNFSATNVARTQARRIADPNINAVPGLGNPFNNRVLGAQTNQPSGAQTNNGGDGNYTGGGGNLSGGGGGGSADAAERAAALYAIEAGLTGARDALGRLDRQRDIGFGNIDRDYQYELDILTGNRSKNLDRYKTQEIDQLNNYQAKRSNNEMGAANWLMGARRQAGMMGAGGGSAARYALPFEAQTQAAAANAGDQATNRANMSAIAGSRQADEDQFINAERDLGRQKEQGRNDLLSRIESQRAELLNTQGTLEGQRAIANGGDYRAALNAANPYTSRISAILNQIDSLAATPKVQARQVTLGRPDLSGYNWARPENAPSPVQDPTQGGGQVYRPYDEEQRVNPITALFGLDERQFA